MGTMMSPAFVIRSSWLSFLIGGKKKHTSQNYQISLEVRKFNICCCVVGKRNLYELSESRLWNAV